MKFFASDNYSPIDPMVLEAINKANFGYAKSYGNDSESRDLADVVKSEFGEKARVFACATGTGANVIALQALAERYEAVVTSTSSHLHVDEGGSPEKFGVKLFTVPTIDGKLDVPGYLTQAWGFGDVHRAQPKVLSIAQSSELGTVYKVEELKELFASAKALGVKIHMDGARLFNAATSLDCSLSEITTQVGVDIVTLGATKNGAMGAEAIIDINGTYSESLGFLRKSSTQLMSKQRFISAQLLALFNSERWRDNAGNANRMAKALREELQSTKEIEFAYPTEANGVFAYLPKDLANKMADELGFYVWDESKGLVRWMTSWDTTLDDVREFAERVRDFIRKEQ